VTQRLLIVGESLVEFVRMERGSSWRNPGSFLGPFPSGAPAICASAAALAGAEVTLVSTVGTDPFGRLVVERLEGDGVDVTRVRMLDEAVTGAAFVAYEADGRRSFIFHVADAAPGLITAEDLDATPERADWIHVSGASLVLSPALSAVIMLAVERVLAHGGGLSFDPNLRTGSSGALDADDATSRLLDAATILLPAEGELDALGVDVEELVRRGTLVCTTAGARGSRLHQPGGVTEIPGIPVSEVDPTGAGDTFAGVFLATFLRTRDAYRAAIAANQAGAAHVSAMGPMERAVGWAPELR
jgi:sugar/nucleoside kinase (ribokinase family)